MTLLASTKTLKVKQSQLNDVRKVVLMVSGNVALIFIDDIDVCLLPQNHFRPKNLGNQVKVKGSPNKQSSEITK